MYLPPHFHETDLPTLHAFIERHSFALLVSLHDGAPFGSHVPLLLEREAGPCGTLRGHVARANPQWEQLAGQRVLAVFAGPHAYVSPSWYEAQNVVPTWNYVAVHAYGSVQLEDEPAQKLALVRRLVERYERGEPQPWTLAEGDPFVERLLGQIVGFRIEIERLEGKWKLSQNQAPERRARVAAALERRGDPDSAAVAEWMRRREA